MALIEWVVSKVVDHETLILSSLAGSVVYCLISQETLRKKVAGGASGFLSALLFSQPFANLVSNGDGVHIYSAIIALCGQFIPQMLQSIVKKFSKVKLMDKLGLKDDTDSN